MKFKYETMDEIVRLHNKENIMYALDTMDIGFEETESHKELAQKLVKAQKEFLHEIFYMASYEDLEAFEIMSKKHGVFSEDDVFTMPQGLFPDLLLDLPIELCLVTPLEDGDGETKETGNVEFLVSQEFLELFKEYLTENQRGLAFALDEMARIIHGCLYYYGALEMDRLYEIVSKQYKELNKNTFKTVLAYKNSLDLAYETEILGNTEYLKSIAFLEEYTLEEVEKWKSSGLKHKKFSREEFFEAGDEIFLENRKSFESVIKHLKPFFKPSTDYFGVDESLGKEFQYYLFMEALVNILHRSKNQNEVIHIFLEAFDFTSENHANEALTLMTNHINNLSSWENLGHSNEEIILNREEKSNVVPLRAFRKKS